MEGMAGACGIWGRAGIPPCGICGSAGMPPVGICGKPPKLTSREMRIGSLVIGTREATSGGGAKATDARPLSSWKISKPVASLSPVAELPVWPASEATRATDAAAGGTGGAVRTSAADSGAGRSRRLTLIGAAAGRVAGEGVVCGRGWSCAGAGPPRSRRASDRFASGRGAGVRELLGTGARGAAAGARSTRRSAGIGAAGRGVGAGAAGADEPNPSDWAIRDSRETFGAGGVDGTASARAGVRLADGAAGAVVRLTARPIGAAVRLMAPLSGAGPSGGCAGASGGAGVVLCCGPGAGERLSRLLGDFDGGSGARVFGGAASAVRLTAFFGGAAGAGVRRRVTDTGAGS